MKQKLLIKRSVDEICLTVNDHENHLLNSIVSEDECCNARQCYIQHSHVRFRKIFFRVKVGSNVHARSLLEKMLQLR